MKRKLAIFGMAGVLLFSGISVSAATNVCGHPSTTTYTGTVNKYPETCKEHANCTKYKVYGYKAVVCHSCGVTFHYEDDFINRYVHVSQ